HRGGDHGRENRGRDQRFHQGKSGRTESARHCAMSSRSRTKEFLQPPPPWTTRTQTRSMNAVVPATTTFAGSTWISRHMTLAFPVTVELPQPCVFVPANHADARVARCAMVAAPSTPLRSPSTRIGPASKSSPNVPPPGGGVPSTTSSIHPPVPGGEFGSNTPPAFIAEQFTGVVVVCVGTFTRVRLPNCSIRACPNS